MVVIMRMPRAAAVMSAHILFACCAFCMPCIVYVRFVLCMCMRNQDRCEHTVKA